MSNPTLKIGDGNWAVKTGNLLGYAVGETSNKFVPRELTFTRASSATRVNSAGLIEKARTNLLLQSNSFSSWSLNTRISETSGQLGYDGSSDAWKIDLTAAAGRVQESNTTSGVQTFSVYAKAGTLNWVRLLFSAGSNQDMFFDLANGVLGTSTYGGHIDATITSVGSGWYRCTLTCNESTSSIRIYPATADGDITATSGNILIQDAQLEQGLVATDVIETTTATVSVGVTADIPRVDYSQGSGPSLLLEPQRTNYILYSEYEASAWAQTTASISTNNAISPDGTQNAHTATRTSSSNARVGTASFSATAGQPYTSSIYLRKVSGSGSIQLIDINNNATTRTLTNEWARYSVTAIASSSVQRLYVNMTQDNDVIEFWGGQVENGSYSTSYIPTYGTSVTRVADACYKTGISDLIGQTEGVLYAEVDLSKSISNRRIISINDGTGNNEIRIGIDSSNFLQFAVIDSGVVQCNIFTSYTLGLIKIAVAYALNDFALYINGTLIGTDTSGTIPPTSNINLGTNTIYTAQLDDRLAQAIVFPTRLTNDELASLTTI